MSSVNKAAADRNQRILLDLISKPGNDVCADCKARSPRWASHNLGIFICVNCASIHRKIGTHITKVKSVTMDAWSKEQVEVMKSIGNIASNAKFNPNEARHPPPANREESERDSELEKFIRWKYEFKRFMRPDKAVLSRPAPEPHRSQTLPPASMARRASPLPPLPPPPSPSNLTKQSTLSQEMQPGSQPGPPVISSLQQQATVPVESAKSLLPAHNTTVSQANQLFLHSNPMETSQPPSNANLMSSHPVWNELMSLTTPSQQPMPFQNSSQTPQIVFQQPSFAPTTGFATPPPSSSVSGTLRPNPPPSRSASLPPFGSTPGSSFQMWQTQPDLATGYSFAQQHSGSPVQITSSLSPFQTTSVENARTTQICYGQPSVSPYLPPHTPSPVFSQQQQSLQIPPASFTQRFMPPGNLSIPNQQLQQQPIMQMQAQTTGNPFGQWQQQQQHGASFQSQFGQWGHM